MIYLDCYYEEKLNFYKSIINSLELKTIMFTRDNSNKYLYYMPNHFIIKKELIYNYQPMEPITKEYKDFRKNINFLTFADKRMTCSLERIKQQALDMDFFNNIYIANENNLEQEYIKKMGNKLIYGGRGFGYWCWKPQIILQVMNKMSNGDILIYGDAGCHLLKNKPESMQEVVDIILKNKGIIGVNMPLHKESEWTKGDLFEYFGIYNDSEFTKTGQFEANRLFIVKNESSYSFVKEWNKVFLENFDLVTDMPSIKPNMEGFRENRHDQSVFSLLMKKYGYTYNNEMINRLLIAKRDKVIKNDFIGIK